MRCPVCGNDVEKAHRHPLERLISVFYSVRRYHCTRSDCNWEGSLHRDGSAADQNDGKASSASRLLWFLFGATALYAGQQATYYYRERSEQFAKPLPIFALYEDNTPASVAKGVDDHGRPLASNDPRGTYAPSSLRVRKGCAWGVPGSNPYKGSVVNALAGTDIPHDVIRKLDYMVERGLVTDKIKITNVGITTEDGTRDFGRTAAAMAFGNTLCFNTRVNFRDGHVEKADMYEATDAKGRAYVIMVPYVCNNVSVLAERRRKTDTPSPPLPEPPILILVLLGLLGIFGLMRRR